MAASTGGAKRPQVTALVDDELERDVALAIAVLKKERDLLGRGLSVVIRRTIKNYVRSNLREWRPYLAPELRQRLDDAGR